MGIVLRFLAPWHPPALLSIKKLTLKTAAMIALASGDRAQSIHLLSVEHVHISAHGVEFAVPHVLKTSKMGQPARVVTCVSWPDERLDVCKFVHKCIDRTLKFRLRSIREDLGKPT